MEPKTWNSNKIKYDVVKNLLTMNHFSIMVLHKKPNLLMLHCFMGCNLLVMFHPNAFECLHILDLSCLNHKCNILIMFQLGLHIKKDGHHTPCNHAKKPKNVARS